MASLSDARVDLNPHPKEFTREQSAPRILDLTLLPRM